MCRLAPRGGAIKSNNAYVGLVDQVLGLPSPFSALVEVLAVVSLGSCAANLLVAQFKSSDSLRCGYYPVEN